MWTEAIFPVKKHDQTVSTRSAKILLVLSIPVSSEDEVGQSVQAVIHALAAASLFICLYLQPGAAVIIRSRERGGEASSCEVWQGRAVLISKLNNKQQ